MFSWVKSVSAEQPDRSFVACRIPFDDVVALVEQAKGEAFEDFRYRHGDWGLAMIFSLARKRTGLTLSQLGEQVGGMGYKTVFARIKYLETRMRKDAALREVYRHCKERLAIRETPVCLEYLV
jgi:hypothetical protein